MRSVWFIARMDVAHQLRQRETLVWLFVMPIVFSYFIGTVTGGGPDPSGSRARPHQLALRAPADGGFLVDDLVRRLEAQNFAVTRPASDEAFERATRRLTVPAPSNGKTFTGAVLAGERQTLIYRSRSEGPSANFDRIRLARAAYGLVADIAIAAEETTTMDAAALRRVSERPRLVTLEVSTAGRRVRVPSGYEQTVPGTLVMFTMLILLTNGAILLVIERERGLLRRLAATPISRSAVVSGKWLARMALGFVQIAFAMLAGTVLFDMAWGRALPMVIVVLIAWAAFNASLALLLGNLARTAAQMSGIGVLTTLVLAALGGCWWPIEITPDWMQTFALFLPTGWAMDAMHKLISFGYGAAAAAPHVLGLAVAALGVGAAGVRTFRYQ